MIVLSHFFSASCIVFLSSVPFFFLWSTFVAFTLYSSFKCLVTFGCLFNLREALNADWKCIGGACRLVGLTVG